MEIATALSFIKHNTTVLATQIHEIIFNTISTQYANKTTEINHTMGLV